MSERQQRSELMQNRLLDAAEALYARDGMGALTNRRIAKEADTTTQAVYTYFGSRERLVERMYERAVEQAELMFSAAADLPNLSDDGIRQAFRVIAAEYRSFCLKYPARFRMIRVAGDEAEAPAAATELRERLVQLVVEFGRSGGGFREAWYESRTRLTLAAIHGFILAELEGFITAENDPDRLFDELVVRCLVNYDDIKIADQA